ncbi:hypothetical protein HHK36_010354 [Tetracentron sinense]|uniref:FAD-binding domain-containing protein n=1 Tax=Tetracentron sinense TaxID=13715 RepID=A0A835DJ33_TETSI|nr:hypothetical protein HHK36_010354 [Tetracentron sinense]
MSICLISGTRNHSFDFSASRRCTVLQASLKQLKVQYDAVQNEDGCGKLDRAMIFVYNLYSCNVHGKFSIPSKFDGQQGRLKGGGVKMDRYQRVEKPSSETPINENENRITNREDAELYHICYELASEKDCCLHQNTSFGSTYITDTRESLEGGLLSEWFCAWGMEMEVGTEVIAIAGIGDEGEAVDPVALEGEVAVSSWRIPSKMWETTIMMHLFKARSDMEIAEDIVIVGAGIAGLTTSLGLHRLGLRSLVLESSDKLRITGFAFTTWTNAWKALDAVGLGDSLRQQHDQLLGGYHEVRCLRRKVLLEALEMELPPGTIRYSSKVVSIEESGYLKLVHLADGSILKAKVLIGCDGVNSVISKWLGLKKPAFTGRSAIRGFAEFESRHGFEPKFLQFFGNGFRSGFLPCDEKTVYWFFTWTPTTQDKDLEENPTKMKEFVLSNLGKVPKEVVGIVENTGLESITSAPLRYRLPWSILWGNICKENVCVAGDALHPMTPDIGQGGCAALEDGVVLARCLAEALNVKPNQETKNKAEEEEYNMIKKGLEKFAKERRWRSFELISTAYMVGFIQQSQGKMMNLIRDKWLSAFLAGLLLKRADFDCGKLSFS